MAWGNPALVAEKEISKAERYVFSHNTSPKHRRSYPKNGARTGQAEGRRAEEVCRIYFPFLIYILTIRKEKGSWLSSWCPCCQAQEGCPAQAEQPQEGMRPVEREAATIITDIPLKKHSAGLTALTEKNLAEKAGHLEMLRGGKKERDDKAKAKAQANKTMGRK